MIVSTLPISPGNNAIKMKPEDETEVKVDRHRGGHSSSSQQYDELDIASHKARRRRYINK